MSLILKMLIVVDCSILEKFLCLVEKEEGKKKKKKFSFASIKIKEDSLHWLGSEDRNRAFLLHLVGPRHVRNFDQFSQRYSSRATKTAFVNHTIRR